MEPPWEVGKKVYRNGTGHMTKMAAMLIYCKNLQKSNRPRYQVSVYRTIGPLVKVGSENKILPRVYGSRHKTNVFDMSFNVLFSQPMKA